ncbi:polysaccharide pyruvyl transferase family protein [Arthrobacter sp. StoSoilB20]|uniref:polysaccharide pyruvyl transferase family protein n=1 Tax=Arthrobacter sp. StoSoilB20 TaxID=2830995 RepID=UPI001CC43216|nr:polysaccharide pyruvyl transferase family protein [Arthrobacter sp. StoSoilB20]BCW59991.1 hypothetical protein StoSoilB20_33380 [Arthrobacter sp. StoSoilB20]
MTIGLQTTLGGKKRGNGLGNFNRLVAGQAAPTLVTAQRRLLGLEKPAKTAPARTAVLSPASYGSFGDEGMIQGSRDSILAASGTPHLLTPGSAEPWSEMGVVGMETFDDVIGLGRMHVNARKLKTLTDAQRIVVLGADSVDGAYGIRSITQRVSLLNVAAAQGRNAELANFSFRRNASQDALAALRRLDPRVRLTARDTNSQARVVEALQRKVNVFPDVAAYMKPASTPAVEQLGAWVSAQDGPTAIVVPNAHLAAFNGMGIHEVTSRFKAYTNALLGAGFSVVVLAHDVRQDPGDIALSETMVRGRSGERLISAVPRNAQEAKGMLALATVVVTARMHAGVAALSQGVPCVGLDYVDKFSGQFKWYDADRFVLSWESHPSAQRIVELAKQAVGDASHAARTTPAFVSRPPSWLL